MLPLTPASKYYSFSHPTSLGLLEQHIHDTQAELVQLINVHQHYHPDAPRSEMSDRFPSIMQALGYVEDDVVETSMESWDGPAPAPTAAPAATVEQPASPAPAAAPVDMTFVPNAANVLHAQLSATASEEEVIAAVTEAAAAEGDIQNDDNDKTKRKKKGKKSKGRKFRPTVEDVTDDECTYPSPEAKSKSAQKRKQSPISSSGEESDSPFPSSSGESKKSKKPSKRFRLAPTRNDAATAPPPLIPEREITMSDRLTILVTMPPEKVLEMGMEYPTDREINAAGAGPMFRRLKEGQKVTKHYVPPRPRSPGAPPNPFEGGTALRGGLHSGGRPVREGAGIWASLADLNASYRKEPEPEVKDDDKEEEDKKDGSGNGSGSSGSGSSSSGSDDDEDSKKMPPPSFVPSREGATSPREHTTTRDDATDLAAMPPPRFIPSRAASSPADAPTREATLAPATTPSPAATLTPAVVPYRSPLAGLLPLAPDHPRASHRNSVPTTRSPLSQEIASPQLFIRARNSRRLQREYTGVWKDRKYIPGVPCEPPVIPSPDERAKIASDYREWVETQERNEAHVQGLLAEDRVLKEFLRREREEMLAAEGLILSSNAPSAASSEELIITSNSSPRVAPSSPPRAASSSAPRAASSSTRRAANSSTPRTPSWSTPIASSSTSGATATVPRVPRIEHESLGLRHCRDVVPPQPQATASSDHSKTPQIEGNNGEEAMYADMESESDPEEDDSIVPDAATIAADPWALPPSPPSQASTSAAVASETITATSSSAVDSETTTISSSSQGSSSTEELSTPVTSDAGTSSDSDDNRSEKSMGKKRAREEDASDTHEVEAARPTRRLRSTPPPESSSSTPPVADNTSPAANTRARSGKLVSLKKAVRKFTGSKSK